LLAVQTTVLLNIITDGEAPLTGIDCDIEINTAVSNFKRRLGPERKQPFMISVLALHGKIVNWRIYAGAGELDLPQVPRLEEEPAVAKTKKSKTESEETTSETEKTLAKAKEKKEEEKPPVVMEMPPGAKLVMPKPVEIQAPAAPVLPQAIAQTSTNLQPSTSSNSESKVELAKGQETNVVAAATVNKGSNEGETSNPEDQHAKRAAVVIPPRPESSATGPLFYCIAVLGFLLPIAAVLLYLQRRANNRGSIISQSLLRDFKSGML
jgi:hypothetical protein